MGLDEHLFRLMEKRVNDSMNDALLKQFTENDITYVVKIMALLKAFGADDYPAIIFQSARELITDGILWRVGNSTRTNIWNDFWLPGRENNRISVQRIMPNWTTVNQLIEHESNTWNKELVLNIVDAATAARIFSIPIFGGGSEDMMVWKYEGSREYTVKGGTLSVEIVCPLCKKDPEDADHLMWSCGILKCVWASLNITILSFGALMCCKNRFANTFSAAKEQQKQFIAISIWGLWFQRNKLLHEVLARDLKGEIVGAETYLFEDVVDAFVAEARACERVLLLACAMGFRHLIVEVGYGAAHTLALEGRRRQVFGVWVDGVPDSVKTMAIKDCLVWNQSHHGSLCFALKVEKVR
ncbi:hypothetical protein PVK06_016584 [Gossypium arboreum]|uniref:Reverse transcriptase zinc-binding domain-containing protein n=1 Tax=Gossypium arboreum TaxID=29729 RepID=A0ABR0Q0M0_GOSAR|nr:hypothetical protein PVK06_016584 [Gossypium arboreum]